MTNDYSRTLELTRTSTIFWNIILIVFLGKADLDGTMFTNLLIGLISNQWTLIFKLGNWNFIDLVMLLSRVKSEA